PTAALREQLAPADERETTLTHYMPEKGSRITRHGTQMFYASANEPGDIFKKGNPMGLRDVTGKRCDAVIGPHSNFGTAYHIAKSFGRNGYWDNSGMKFIVDYERDSWYADCS